MAHEKRKQKYAVKLVQNLTVLIAKKYEISWATGLLLLDHGGGLCLQTYERYR